MKANGATERCVEMVKKSGLLNFNDSFNENEDFFQESWPLKVGTSTLESFQRAYLTATAATATRMVAPTKAVGSRVSGMVLPDMKVLMGLLKR